VRLTSSITCLVGVLHHSVQPNKQREKKFSSVPLSQSWIAHRFLCVWERNASVRKMCQWGTRVNYTSSCIVWHSNLDVNVVENIKRVLLFQSLEISVFWSRNICMNGELCFVSWTIIKVTMKLRLTFFAWGQDNLSITSHYSNSKPQPSNNPINSWWTK